jgi:hypothetical protein
LLFQLHLYDDTLIAFLGFDSLKITRHEIAGDTITAKKKEKEKRETRIKSKKLISIFI